MDIIGRDGLIKQVWRRLETQSVEFVAERRIGKTMVMQHMKAKPLTAYTPFYIDLERVESPHRLVEVLLEELHPLFSKTEKSRIWFNNFLKQIDGLEIAGAITINRQEPALDWQTMLAKTLSGVCENQSDAIIVLLLDEVPYMLQKVAVEHTGATAIEILDILRAARNSNDNLRMIFAGSIGLHHVLTDSRHHKIPSQPTNDMDSIEIGPLIGSDARILAEKLIDNEGIEVADGQRESVIDRLVVVAGQVPFYIERLVYRLAEAGHPVTAKDVQNIFEEQLTSDLDPWKMEHFRDRLPIYYPGTMPDAQGKLLDRAMIASAILDTLAVSQQPLSIDAICQALTAVIAIEDRRKVVELLKLLARDHYLVSDTQKHYRFRYTLIQQWWVLAQGLDQ